MNLDVNITNNCLLGFSEYHVNDDFLPLKMALDMAPEKIVEEISESGLVGRGGAGFPAGLKMKFVADQPSEEKYIICNADEGEPGTFKDRELLRRNPAKLIEAMVIAAYAVGAHKGYLYVRGEYNYLKEDILAVLQECREQKVLGANILGHDFSFDIEYRSGIGAYVCGEETALIESIEGRSGDPRIKPPYTAEEGLWGKPTLVNNVETLINVLPIIAYGAEKYKSVGTAESSGSKLFSLSGAVNKPGVYEVPFGLSLRELIDTYGGGAPSNEIIKFVQVGGSSGTILPADRLDTILSYEIFRAFGANLGSGAVLVVDASVCVVDYLKATAGFFAHESCGKCTPCREGNRHIKWILEKMSQGMGTESDIELIKRTSRVMEEASFCGLGQTATTGLVSMVENFLPEIVEHTKGHCPTGVCEMRKKVE